MFEIAGQADINARMRPWGNAEFRRFEFRTNLFRRRGLSEDAATALADRLALRDQEHDGRRACFECADMQRSGHCWAVKQGRMQVACGSDRFTAAPTLLQRCSHFTWAKPT